MRQPARCTEFILGPRKTALRPGELVTAVLVPEAERRGAQPLPQARRAQVPGDLDRHGERRDRAQGRQGRAGARRRRLLLAGGAAPAGARSANSRASASTRRLPTGSIAAQLALLQPIADVRGEPRLSQAGGAGTGAAPAAGDRVNRPRAEFLAGTEATAVHGQRPQGGEPRAAHGAPRRRAARRARADRHQDRLQRRRLRRLHGAARRPPGLRLPDAARAGRRRARWSRSRAWRRTASSRRCRSRSRTTARRNAASARRAC